MSRSRSRSSGLYGAIALFLELFVLPSQVYLPIDRLRRADEAVRAGRRNEELIAENDIPSDELGDIMRSRNSSILELRDQEHRLEDLLCQVEGAATELKKKNDLLEAAQRNLADQDRLVSLGIMSAGIAHEMNTPLAVLKGSAEQLAESADIKDRSLQNKVAMMRRVIARLERLSESLLDFARARPRIDRHGPDAWCGGGSMDTREPGQRSIRDPTGETRSMAGSKRWATRTASRRFS